MKSWSVILWTWFDYLPFMILCFLAWGGCTGTNWNSGTLPRPVPANPSNFASVLVPEPEDIPFLHAIAEDQEKRLSSCKSEEECRAAHFLRGLAALYENRELAALHFRKVVVSRPNSTLAGESRFWLWFLDVLNSPSGGGFTSQDLTKRLAREVVEKEFLIHELSGKLENASVEALQQELGIREQAVEELNQMVATLTQQAEQLKKEQSLRQEVQQELKASEQKIQELTNQLEALRRIDQEIREKAPPTRPSEKMTPTPELEKPVEKEMKKNAGKDKK